MSIADMDRLRMRLMLEDGTTVFEHMARLGDARARAEEAGAIANSYVDQGHTVTLQYNDPDGIISPAHIWHTVDVVAAR